MTKEFSIRDIFVVNTAMRRAKRDHQEAWQRVRAKLIEAADIKPPVLRTPTRITDREDGRGIDFHYDEEPQ